MQQVREITEREIALGRLNRPLVGKNDPVKRFLESGDIVKFSLSRRTREFNAELLVNGNPMWIIWVSQLDKVFVKAEGRGLYCGYIEYRNGEVKNLGYISTEDFLDAVEGRTFKVSRNNGMFAIDEFNEKVQELHNFRKVGDYIFDALDEKRYGDVKGMTKQMPLYSFIEI